MFTNLSQAWAILPAVRLRQGNFAVTELVCFLPNLPGFAWIAAVEGGFHVLQSPLVGRERMSRRRVTFDRWISMVRMLNRGWLSGLKLVALLACVLWLPTTGQAASVTWNQSTSAGAWMNTTTNWNSAGSAAIPGSADVAQFGL